MKNAFIFEGVVKSVDTRTSARGNAYYITRMECGRDSLGFILFKEEPIPGHMYRLTGHLSANDKGFTQTSVDKCEELSAPAPVPAQTAPPAGPDDINDDDMPF